jgi:hypothetical protein
MQPQPFAVARSCAPSYTMRVQSEVRGSDHQLSKTLHEQCVDRGVGVASTHREARDPYSVYREGELERSDGTGVYTSEYQGIGEYQHQEEYTTPNTFFGFSIEVTRP